MLRNSNLNVLHILFKVPSKGKTFPADQVNRISMNIILYKTSLLENLVFVKGILTKTYFAILENLILWSPSL